MSKVIARPTVAAAAVASAFLLAAGHAGASGFQLQEQGASGLGVAYSGMAAAVQDASTAFWNPAGMSHLSGKFNVAGALHYIIPSTKFSDSGSTWTALGNGGQGGDDAWVPAVFGTWQINPQWTVGLAVNAPFGLGTEWDTPWSGQYHAIKSEIETLNINPSVAFKVNNMVSLGLGVSYQQLKATLTNAVTPAIPGSVGQVEGDDWGWGWNIGAMFDFQQGTRIGITYRSEIDYTIEGDLTFNSPALAAGQGNVTADVTLPATFSIGLSHQFNKQLRVLADYTWTGWDSIQNLTIVRSSNGATVSNTPLSFKDSWRIGVGAEYQLNNPWLLRVGVAYDRSPVQDEFRTPRLPDNDRTWLAVGARYTASQALSFDVGYTYIWVDDASSQLPSTGPVPGTLNGSYNANVQVIAVQANYRF
jgi:long-chain fatty acid transport protein